MNPKITIPSEWQVPDSIRARVAEVPGTQRCIEVDGHLILVLHKLPGPEDLARDVRLFWRSSDGSWESNTRHGGPKSLERHVTEFNDRLLTLEEREDNATTAEDYFQIRHQVAPIYRAAKNMAAAIARAYEMFQDDRNLLVCRNLSATVERTADLLKEDATFALDFFMAKQAESQALASHRLNIIAAIFFPILAFSSVFGMNLEHGFENKPTWLFWLFVGIGILIGTLMTILVVRTRKDSMAKMKNKYD